MTLYSGFLYGFPQTIRDVEYLISHDKKKRCGGYIETLNTRPFFFLGVLLQGWRRRRKASLQNIRSHNHSRPPKARGEYGARAHAHRAKRRRRRRRRRTRQQQSQRGMENEEAHFRGDRRASVKLPQWGVPGLGVRDSSPVWSDPAPSGLKRET